MIKNLTITTIALFLTSCAINPKQAIQPNTIVADNVLVILVSTAGPAGINYLQFCHSKTPCLNYEGISIQNDIVALPMTVNMKDLELNTFTLEGKGGFYLPNGMGIGFNGLDDKPININQAGIYFHVHIDTSEDGGFTTTPPTEMLRKAKQKYGNQISHLKPINFTWPE